jgi:hypothetical protein
MSTSVPGGSLVFSTDFENVTKLNANQLNMGAIPNYFEFQGYGGAAIWMEGLNRETPGITCHSGSRCVGMELTDISRSRRNEFNIMNLTKVVGNELFVSVWLYLPANWTLHSPTNLWYEIMNPFFTDKPSYLPYAAFHIYQSSINHVAISDFTAALDVTDISGIQHNYAHVNDYPLPIGRWFNLEYYVYRHQTDGIVQVWIDGSLLFNVGNISTENPSVQEWYTTVAKIYYSTDDHFSPYRIWVDDLEIYSGHPVSTATLPGGGYTISEIPVPWLLLELIIVAFVIALAAVIIARRRRDPASSHG